MRITRFLALSLLAVAITSTSAAFGRSAADTKQVEVKPAYLDPSLPIDQRVDDLVSRMTTEEKASQLVHRAKSIPRLQVPAYNWWSEALHGVMTDGVTIFPEPIGLGATFDPALIRDMATVIGTEARAKHHEMVRQGQYQGVGLDFWAPNINIFRDPRWGRGQETYGEDPYLTGRLGVAFVTGMQGDDPKYLRVIATPKHYAVHSGPEPLRHTFDVTVSKHDMADTYLPAFRAAVVEGKAASVMCVYNSVNGEPGCANNFLLGDQLRANWGFTGYVVSDCDAVYDIYRGHHFTKTLAEAGAISLKRGTDLDCNEPGDDYSRYADAVKQGLVSEKDLDVAVKRLFRARFALGMFDPPQSVAYAQTPISEANSPEHRALAAKVARESMVLLKNDGALPLGPKIKRIAVIGPLADSTRVLQGNYHGSTTQIVTALEGLRKQFPNAKITFEPGTVFLRETTVPIPAAMLSTPDGNPGLNAEYFRGINLEGTPVATRVDKDVNFEFGGTVAPGLFAQDFSVRWTGFITPAESGVFKIGATADDGYRLWIDGKLIVEDWTTHAPSTKTVELPLEKGRKYSVKMEYFQGGGGAVAKLVWQPRGKSDAELTAAAAASARNADVVIAVVGINSDLEGEEMSVDVPGFKGGDRTSIDLPQPEEALLKAVKATGKPLIVVLMNGSALAVNCADKNANAILEAWYAGEEGGTAIAETLAGVNNPAGRLPVTFYAGVDQLPAFEDYSMQNRTYRYFTGKPLYPFGHGLSYSSFAYSNLKLSKTALEAGDPLVLEAEVKNTSKREGDEVVQVYISFPNEPGAPLLALRGFERVHLAPGESKQVSFKLDPRDLSSVNERGDRVVRAGQYRITVGGGQPGFGAPAVEAGFTISGEQIMPD
jgi:beta-glucosidase